ncbi:MAG: hypothetical protein U9N36_02850, partial [Euryarchaeota archaeon]|nr:hypothetical protein [Euryarchaeota archaeon]
MIAFKYVVGRIRDLPSAKVFENRLYGLYILTPLMADSDLSECLHKVEIAVKDKKMDVDFFIHLFIYRIHSKKYGKSIPRVETTVQSHTKLPKPECQLPLITYQLVHPPT